MVPEVARLADPWTTWTTRSPAAVREPDADSATAPDVITVEEAVRAPVADRATAPPDTTDPEAESVPVAFRAA
jgi:hypothetical protein